jgi:hypothetical protein
MSKRIVFLATAMALATPAIAAERVCSGALTDMRAIGITLGDCDLNSVSEEDFKRVTNVCGVPGGIDAPNETKCRVSATSSPHKTTNPTWGAGLCSSESFEG